MFHVCIAHCMPEKIHKMSKCENFCLFVWSTVRHLDGRGPWAVASERSEDATKGPRLSKSHIFIGRAV